MRGRSGRAYAGFALFVMGAGCAASVPPSLPAATLPAASAISPAPSLVPPALAASASPEAVTAGDGPRVVRGGSLFGTDVVGLPTGADVTPDAAPGSKLFELDPHVRGAAALRAGNAVAAALSPDGATLLVLTSGYNRVFHPETGLQEPLASTEWVFVYDVRSGVPVETQVLPVPNAFGGIAFGPDGAGPRQRFYVSGGPDDVVRAYAKDGSEPGARWAESGAPVKLGHLDTGESHEAHAMGGLGEDESPYAAGVAVTPSGARLVVANHENDSISIVELGTGAVSEIALRPGKGKAGGEFPLGIALAGETRAFVTAQRDREVVVVDLAAKQVVRRIPVGGQPSKLVMNRAGTTLYVANANSDSVSVIDVAKATVTATLPTAAPPGNPALHLRGSNPNALALSADESRLYVTNGGNNTLAVIDLAARRVLGLVPTGDYPTAVAVSVDGGHLFVVNAKSATGPNPLGPWTSPRAVKKPYTSGRGNQYALQLEHAGLLALPTPDDATLEKLTRQAIANNRWDVRPEDVPPLFRALRGKVKHVIYVIGENRTYDQILGDVAGADGDPRLTLWGEAITPNHHALARTFVLLDRFFDAGGVSGEGWQWSTSGRTTDVAEKAIPIEYASRGHHSYDWEGANRNVNVSWPTLAGRKAANPATPDAIDLLPGSADVGAVDGPAEGGRGFLWDAVLASGQDVRNYGCFCDDTRYGLKASDPAYVAPTRDAYATRTRVAFPTRASLHERTDPYFRCFDQRVADLWREKEWARELDGYVKSGKLPALEIVRLPHDHLGAFESAEDGVTTPDTQIADNDYALGALIEKVSRSPFWKDTIVVALEDDAQNGSDHVDAHRSFVLMAGAHVKRGVKVSTPYATPSVLRTIELLLGVAPLGQQDAFAPPMGELLDEHEDLAPFVAEVPAVLRSTQLPLPAAAGAKATRPRGDRTFWATVTRGQDFSRADALDEPAFNQALVCGLAGGAGCVSRPN